MSPLSVRRNSGITESGSRLKPMYGTLQPSFAAYARAFRGHGETVLATAGFEPAGGGYAEFVRVLPFVLPGVVKIPAGNSFLPISPLDAR